MTDGKQQPDRADGESASQRVPRPSPESASEKTEVLLQRYEHLNVAHYQHNQVIHTTFYLSVVFFAGFLSIIFTVGTDGSFIPLLSLFASVIFLLLGVWAWRYNRGREEIKDRQRIIKEELGRTEFDLLDDRTIEDTFFIEHDHSGDAYKKVWHTSYYLILALLSFVIPYTIL